MPLLPNIQRPRCLAGHLRAAMTVPIAGTTVIVSGRLKKKPLSAGEHHLLDTNFHHCTKKGKRGFSGLNARCGHAGSCKKAEQNKGKTSLKFCKHQITASNKASKEVTISQRCHRKRGCANLKIQEWMFSWVLRGGARLLVRLLLQAVDTDCCCCRCSQDLLFTLVLGMVRVFIVCMHW